MAQQQLNLFDPLLRPPRVWLTPWRLLIGALALLALLKAGAWWLDNQAKAANGRATAQEAQLLQLAQQAQADRPDDAAQERELALLRQRVQLAQRLADAQAGAGDERRKATELLAALSRAAPGDVWLTRAQWQAGQGASPARIALEGQLLDAKRLPAYLRRLEAQEAFAGQQFTQLQVRPPSADADPSVQGHPSFVLRSYPKEPGQ